MTGWLFGDSSTVPPLYPPPSLLLPSASTSFDEYVHHRRITRDENDRSLSQRKYNCDVSFREIFLTFFLSFFLSFLVLDSLEKRRDLYTYVFNRLSEISLALAVGEVARIHH